jgi:hypothetical protein
MGLQIRVQERSYVFVYIYLKIYVLIDPLFSNAHLLDVVLLLLNIRLFNPSFLSNLCLSFFYISLKGLWSRLLTRI